MEQEKEIKILTRLRRFLDEIKYGQIISNLLLINGVNELIQINDYNRMKAVLFNVDEEIRDLMSLFLLGMPIRRNKTAIIPIDLLDDLISIDILRSDSQYIQTNNLMIIKALNKLLIVEIPYYFPTCSKSHTEVYIGLDSYMLMLNLYEKLQLNKYSKAIDICCGSGLQAIITSDYVDHVDAIELNAYAARIARYNTFFNRCHHKVRVINKNYFEFQDSLADYDLVISNPPFLPITDDLQFSTIGNGGEDGLRFLRQILSDFKELGTDADGIFIGECFGSETESDILNMLRITEEKAPYVVLYTVKSCTEDVVNRIAHMVSVQAGIHYQNAHSTISSQLCKDKPYYYTYIVEIGNAQRSKKCIDMANKWRCSDIPVFENRLKKEESTSYYIRTTDGYKMQVSKGVMKCLSDIDGKTSISELLKNNLAFLSQEDTTEVFLSVCAELQRLKLLEKRT